MYKTIKIRIGWIKSKPNRETDDEEKCVVSFLPVEFSRKDIRRRRIRSHRDRDRKLKLKSILNTHVKMTLVWTAWTSVDTRENA